MAKPGLLALWKRANLSGGVAAFTVGVGIYVLMIFVPDLPKRSGILFALPASAITMYLMAIFGTPDAPEMIDDIETLHRDE